MIKQSEKSKVWFFYDEHEPIACTIYHTCTDHSSYMVIIEEPSEGGPDIQIYWYNKPMVAAAFGIHNNETGLDDYFIAEWDGYEVSIPQVLHNTLEDKYFIGVLTKKPDDTGYTAEKIHDEMFSHRKDAVEMFLADKIIGDRISILSNSELPF